MAKIKKREKKQPFMIEEHYHEPQPFQPKLEPLTATQSRYLNAIAQNLITFGYGSAGTGKSYIPIAFACSQLMKKNVEKIIFTRPAVECDEKYGFLPGELNEKLEPYYQPIKDAIYKQIGRGHADYFIKRGVIDFRPLAFLRGTTFENCIVILDEAQNTTPNQMMMFLTRIGENTKFIINGDVSQSDLKGNSGLTDALYKLKEVERVSMIRFTFDDVVRSGICKDILRAYES